MDDYYQARFPVLPVHLRWAGSKLVVIKTTNPETPIIGYREVPSPAVKGGVDLDMIQSIGSFPGTHEVCENYDSGTIVVYTGEGIYPVREEDRRRCETRIYFKDGPKLTIKPNTAHKLPKMRVVTFSPGEDLSDCHPDRLGQNESKESFIKMLFGRKLGPAQQKRIKPGWV